MLLIIKKLLLSLFFAALFYFLWLAVFLLSNSEPGSIIRRVLWISAPFTTALGFTVGMALSEKTVKAGWFRFLKQYTWALSGCALGAVTAYRFGPMLIVFGMFICGSISIILCELIVPRNNQMT